MFKTIIKQETKNNHPVELKDQNKEFKEANENEQLIWLADIIVAQLLKETSTDYDEQV